MKIRLGHVSNSSSSSFIIAIKDGGKCPHCGRRDIKIDELVRMIENSTHNHTEMIAEGLNSTIEWINEWIKDCYYSDEGKDKMLKIADKAKELSKNSEIMVLEVSYYNEFLNDKLENSENIEVLYKCGD